MVSELLEHFNLNKLLDGEPGKIGQPLLDWVRVGHISLDWAVDKEVHLLLSVFNVFQNTLLHQSEGELAHEDLLVTLEETAGHPLVDGHTDAVDQSLHSLFVLLELVSLLDSLEEEGLE